MMRVVAGLVAVLLAVMVFQARGISQLRREMAALREELETFTSPTQPLDPSHHGDPENTAAICAGVSGWL
jgi:hypothetical protein